MSNKYYHTKESVNEYINLAKDVNGAQLINKLGNYLSPDSVILELGSGPGTDWKILNKSHVVIGSDNSKVFLNHLRTENPNFEFLDLDAITLRTQDKFDAIYSNKVLIHLNDEELKSSIERQYQILNSGGVICHSFWKGVDSEIFKGLFVNYHDKKDIEKFFKDWFDIISIEYYAEFEEDDSILLLGKKR